MRKPEEWRCHLADLRAYQPWPCYYEFRAGELDVVQALCAISPRGTLLELGCGNAFHSYLLSPGFDRVVATDLHAEDPRSHTIGLHNARSLARILSFPELTIVGASAEALPLAADSVDLVFSSNVLEHVPGQEKAVEEIWRVLRPGGHALTIVPSCMERVYNLPVSYVLMIRSMLTGLRRHLGGKGEPAAPVSSLSKGSAGTAPRSSPSLLARVRGFFRRHYPTFPYPKPHGEYDSSTAEFMAHRPSRWESLFRQQGFVVQRTFTTILAPHNLGVALSPRVAYWIARAGWPLTRMLGARDPFKRLGTSYAILVRKPDR